MKKIIVLLIATIFVVESSFAQGINFRDIGYADAIELAKKENKSVFVDIYTSWCGPCIRLARDIFVLEDVGKFYNDNFISVKFDAEKNKDGVMLASKFNVTSYPTLLYINSEGDLVYRLIGGRDGKGMISEGKKALEACANIKPIKEMAKRHSDGEKSKEFILEYFNLVTKAGLEYGDDLLIDYFYLLEDIDYLEVKNINLIGSIKKYDKSIIYKAIDIAQKAKDNGTASVEFIKEFSSSYSRYLNSMLIQSFDNGDIKGIKRLYKIKKQFYAIVDAKDRMSSAVISSTISIYTPNDIVLLKFYKNNKMNRELIAKVDSYVDELYALSMESSKKYEGVLSQRDKIINGEDFKKGDKKKQDGFMKTILFTAGFMEMEIYYSATSMMEAVKYYDEVYSKNKDEKYKDKVSQWYYNFNFAYPSCYMAYDGAQGLLSLGKKDMAKKVLENALNKGKERMMVQEKHITDCQELLDKLQK